MVYSYNSQHTPYNTYQKGPFMQLSVNGTSPLPPYIQVANQIADQIRGGNIPRGTRLPSVRKLTGMAGVSHTTANKVLDHLEESGLIERIHGSGSFSLFNPPFDPHQAPSLSYIQNKFLNARRSKELRSVLVGLLKNTTQTCRYNFSYAMLNPDLINRLIPSPADPQVALHDIQWSRTYGDMAGLMELRHALRESFAPDHNEESILITHGNQHGLHLIAETLLGKGDAMLMESPTYTGAVDIFSNTGAHVLPVHIHRDGFDEQAIEALCKKFQPKLFYMTPDFSNPTGYCLTTKERKALLELADKWGFLIVEDDPWSELSFIDNITPLGLMSPCSPNVIYLKGFSKIIGAQYRIGALFAHTTLIEKFKKALTIQSLGVSELSQFYLLGLLAHGSYKKAIPKIIMELKARAGLVNKALAPLRKYDLQFECPTGGLNTWVELPESMNTEELLFKTTYPKGISFLPGSIACSTEDFHFHNCLRFSYGYVSKNNLKTGLSQFVSLLEHKLSHR